MRYLHFFIPGFNKENKRKRETRGERPGREKESNHFGNEMACQVSCSLALLCFSPSTEQKRLRKEFLSVLCTDQLLVIFSSLFHFCLSICPNSWTPSQFHTNVNISILLLFSLILLLSLFCLTIFFLSFCFLSVAMPFIFQFSLFFFILSVCLWMAVMTITSFLSIVVGLAIYCHSPIFQLVPNLFCGLSLAEKHKSKSPLLF